MVKVLFDFDLFGVPMVDTHLFDIMVALKAELRLAVAQYQKEIINDGGIILVTLRPEKLALHYHYLLNDSLSHRVQPVLERFNWERAADRFSFWANN